jgi:hypothetical protein
MGREGQQAFADALRRTQKVFVFLTQIDLRSISLRTNVSTLVDALSNLASDQSLDALRRSAACRLLGQVGIQAARALPILNDLASSTSKGAFAGFLAHPAPNDPLGGAAAAAVRSITLPAILGDCVFEPRPLSHNAIFQKDSTTPTRSMSETIGRHTSLSIGEGSGPKSCHLVDSTARERHSAAGESHWVNAVYDFGIDQHLDFVWPRVDLQHIAVAVAATANAVDSTSESVLVSAGLRYDDTLFPLMIVRMRSKYLSTLRAGRLDLRALIDALPASDVSVQQFVRLQFDFELAPATDD